MMRTENFSGQNLSRGGQFFQVKIKFILWFFLVEKIFDTVIIFREIIK